MLELFVLDITTQFVLSMSAVLLLMIIWFVVACKISS
jgi:hypothetical protein